MVKIPPSSQPSLDARQVIRFGYTNHRDEYSIRNVLPIDIKFTGADHPYYTGQWVLNGYDLVKKAYRTFAFNRIDGFLK